MNGVASSDDFTASIRRQLLRDVDTSELKAELERRDNAVISIGAPRRGRGNARLLGDGCQPVVSALLGFLGISGTASMLRERQPEISEEEAQVLVVIRDGLLIDWGLPRARTRSGEGGQP